jgi:hypothetical protein
MASSEWYRRMSLGELRSEHLMRIRPCRSLKRCKRSIGHRHGDSASLNCIGKCAHTDTAVAQLVVFRFARAIRPLAIRLVKGLSQHVASARICKRRPGERSQAALLSIFSALPIFCCVLASVSRMWCSGVIQNLSNVSLTAAFVPSSSSRNARSLAWDILGPRAAPRFPAESRREFLEVFW